MSSQWSKSKSKSKSKSLSLRLKIQARDGYAEGCKPARSNGSWCLQVVAGDPAMTQDDGLDWCGMKAWCRQMRATKKSELQELARDANANDSMTQDSRLKTQVETQRLIIIISQRRLCRRAQACQKQWVMVPARRGRGSMTLC